MEAQVEENYLRLKEPISYATPLFTCVTPLLSYAIPQLSYTIPHLSSCDTPQIT
jgi:hypothetical protein